MLQHTRTLPRILGVAQQVGRCPIVQPGPAQPASSIPARRAQRLVRGHPNPLQRRYLVSDPSVLDRAARIGARVYRHPRLPRRSDPPIAAGIQVAHVRGIG